MIFNIGCHHLLLPSREAASNEILYASSPAAKMHDFMREHHAERFRIKSPFRRRILDRALELECGPPQRRVLEEKSRRQKSSRKVRIGMDLECCRIEVEVQKARRRAGLLPFMI